MNKRIIHTVFEQQALRLPQQIAIEEEGGRQISYRELNRQSNRLAGLLRHIGVTKDSVVSVVLPASIQLSTSLLAIFKAGGVYMPMDLVFPRKQLLRMFTQTECRIIITSKALQPSVQSLVMELGVQPEYLLVLGDNGIHAGYWYHRQAFKEMPLNMLSLTDENPELVNEPGDSNYIFYTSGSTGEAKAFLGCHDSLSHFIHWEMKEFQVDERFKVSQLAQITFDASLRDILLPLSTGATLCIPSVETRSNALRLLEWMESAQLTLVHCVPSLLRLMTKTLLQEAPTPLRLPSLKHILMAGEALYGKDLQQWRATPAQHVELVNMYGTSETTLAKTFHRISEIPEDPSQVMHVGKPISNTAILIMNGDMLCEPGKIGEVYIRTPFMTKGYYKDEALTRQVFVQHPHVTDKVELMHKTGDMGKYRPDGSIEILGRLDEQVKVSGIRVELNEVKEAVLTVAGITEAIVLAHRNNEQQNELICYYIGEKVEANDIREQLAGELNENIIPAYFVKMKEFPLTVNGKVDKRALPKPEALVLDPDDYEPVSNEMERALEDMWKEILGLNKIGRKASFFKIGGTSLKAIMLISRIYKQYNVLVKISDIFSRSTIGQLAAFIAGAENTTYKDIPLVPPMPYYDTTHAQKRLWIQDQFETGQIVYNMPTALLINGKLDAAVLEKALQAVIARHESLRTTFVNVNSELKQQVHDTIGFRLQQADLRNEKDADGKVKELAMAAMNTAFDLANGPLIQAQLLQLSAAEYVFLFNTHHIISDGWSEGILVKEIFGLYEAYSKGDTAALPPLKIQYKDYAAWLNKQLDSEQLQQHQQYWAHKFSGELPVLLFPTDNPRPAVKTTSGDVYDFYLDTTLSAGLHALARKEESSMFILLLAAVKALLNRYTGQEDLVIGSPVAGRHHKDTEGLVGLFVNMLALRTQFSTSGSFKQLLTAVKQTALEGFEHQVYPFDELVKQLDQEHDSSRSPLTDVWVQLADEGPALEQAPEGLIIQEYPAGYLTSKVDLTFKFTMGENVRVMIEYNTDLFAGSTIESIGQNFLHLLETVIADTDVRLADVDLLASGESAAEMEDFLKSMQNM
jgi:amino acid adenylation domain-containing protein